MLSTTRIRLVALDLDGTLIGEDLVLRPRVREAVARARAEGVAVTIVTGRMFAAARQRARTGGRARLRPHRSTYRSIASATPSCATSPTT